VDFDVGSLVTRRLPFESVPKRCSRADSVVRPATTEHVVTTPPTAEAPGMKASGAPHMKQPELAALTARVRA